MGSNIRKDIKKEKTRGITLIALVVTIIILLILAGITIAMLFGEHGIIKIAQKAKGDTENAQKDELEGLSKLEQDMKDVIDNIGYTKVPDIEGAIKFEGLYWENGKASVVAIKTISDDLKIEYQVINSNGEVVIEYTEIGNGEIISNLSHGDTVTARLTDGKTSGSSATINIKDENEPMVDVTKEKATSSSIKVNVTAIDNETGIPESPIYKYYIKESSEEDYSEELAETSNSASNTFTGLNPNTTYDIKVEIADKVGNTGVGELENISTGNVPTIEYSPNGDTTYKKAQFTTVTVSENSEEVSSIKYQWLETTETPSESTFTTTCNIGDTLTKNEVTGRWYLWTLLELEDGTTNISRSGVFYLDNQGPTVTLTFTPVSTTSFTLNATASDSHIGTISSYKFYVNGTLKSTQTTSSRTASYTATVSTMGSTSCYVEVTDSLGNPTTSYKTATTKLYTWEVWDTTIQDKYTTEVGSTVNLYGTNAWFGIAFDANRGFYWAREVSAISSTDVTRLGPHMGEYFMCTDYKPSGSAIKNQVYIYSGRNDMGIIGKTVKAVSTGERIKGSNKETKDATSANRNQYPDNGVQGNKYYIYKGIM